MDAAAPHQRLALDLSGPLPTLVLEGLNRCARAAASPAATDQLISTPRLCLWLSCGQRGNVPPAAAEDTLWQLIAGASAPQPAPVAAATRLLDRPQDAQGPWLRADPVHLRADLNRVYLLAHGPQLAISESEQAQLQATLKRWLAEDDLHFDAPHRDRWYVQTGPQPHLQLPHPAQVLGRDLAQLLPETAASRQWFRWMTETQMLLHDHPVNLQRRAVGMPEINSLWFWGGGSWPAQLPSGYQLGESEWPFLQALEKIIRPKPGALAPLQHWSPGLGEAPAAALARLEHAVDTLFQHRGRWPALRLMSDEGFYCLLPATARPSLWHRLLRTATPSLAQLLALEPE